MAFMPKVPGMAGLEVDAAVADDGEVWGERSLSMALQPNVGTDWASGFVMAEFRIECDSAVMR
jgi:hypothetical protein